MEILIGCDPEFFVKKDGKHVSAYNLVPGTKSNPHFVEAGAVQVDGMALEYNIVPARNVIEFVQYNGIVREELRKMVPAEYEFDFVPVAHFERDYINSQPTVARVLGCNPDYNAYTGKTNSPPDSDMNFRTASGHVHIGWTNGMDPYDPEHFEACCMLAKQLDHSLYLASLIYDPDRTRQELYGKPGAFRPKSYGMEYRVVSNAWLSYEWGPQFVYHLAYQAVRDLLDGRRYYDMFPYDIDIHTIHTKPLKIINSYLRAISSVPFPDEWEQFFPESKKSKKLKYQISHNPLTLSDWSSVEGIVMPAIATHEGL